MPSVQTAACAHCGAPMPMPTEPTSITCQFCRNTQLVAPRSTQAAPPAPAPQIPRHAVQPQASRAALPLVAAGIVVLAVVGGIASAVFVRGTPTGGDKAKPGSGGVVPRGEHLQWASSVKHSVVPIRLDADEVEDFVGAYHLFDGGKQTFHVGAFDGKSLERIWGTPAMSELGGGAHVGVAGNRVIATDSQNRIHVLELATGKELALIGMSDQARRMCTPSDGHAEAWIQLADKQHVLVDTSSGTARISPEPGWCPAVDGDCPPTRTPCRSAQDHTQGANHPFKVDGVYTQYLLEEGTLQIAVGTKMPGTPTPMLLGATSGELKWKQVLPQDPLGVTGTREIAAELHRGKLYVTHAGASDKPAHLVTVDAASGQRLKDVVIPRGTVSEPETIEVSDTRVYVAHWTWLDIFDASSSEHIGTVGKW